MTTERGSQGNELSNRLQGFSRWKKRQLRTLSQLEPWLKQQGLFTAEAQRAIQSAVSTLSQDHITVAVVGEFSRGKTELINALFFSDHDFRLLPTDAGRTTMCPTEIFQDDTEDPYLRLLPITTRMQETSLNELRSEPDHWEHIPLKLNDTEQLHNALLKIKESRAVPIDDAERMGLFDAKAMEDPEQQRLSDTTIKVPAWRLAQLNYRHPLLAQGLRILDTPGLNAISSEPELTYEILPSTQARLFVLGADTGVTHSDMEMWQQFVRHSGSRNQRGIMVVLNKTDTLWDELRPPTETEESIRRQCHDVAHVLDISQKQVFALSAQKALVGRVKKDQELERRSGILQMEKQLAGTLIQNRQELIMDHSTELVRSAINSIEALVASRLNRVVQQTDRLNDLSHKSESAISQMLKKTQIDRGRYQASINAYKKSRADFAIHGKLLLDTLAENVLEQPVTQAKTKMTRAWTTTRGLKEAIRLLFEDINHHMQIASDQSQEMRRLIRTIHRRFETRHQMKLGDPKMFSIISHQVELNLVHQESEIFRNSPRTTLTEQHLLTKRYFQTIVRRVEEIFRSAHNDAKDWLETALDPLTMQIHEHRSMLTEQLSDLKHAGHSRSTVKQRVDALQKDINRLENQLSSLRNVDQALGNRRLPAKDGKVKPTLVRKSA